MIKGEQVPSKGVAGLQLSILVVKSKGAAKFEDCNSTEAAFLTLLEQEVIFSGMLKYQLTMNTALWKSARSDENEFS
ncbi:hypothetical protein O6P43_004705 [Quillaja saponaria]|uniref:Uncharacterized protein n=1 Tax=Quillaja saponaria TaxID=32244 RepID=A0AAD7Q4F4_QUISA|nr:hypothetical protein O6P43_004705 [Quillaja saponaria]